MNYYNENDPFAAAWLRELIKTGQIALGEVDERDIREIQPADLEGFTQCHFFAGIGVWSYALRAAGWADDTPVWTGSCPCQSFSASGKRGGFSDQRHLWPAWFRLIRELRPQHIFGEQTSGKDGLAWLDLVSADLEGIGYTFGATDIPACGFGAPHKRNRLYFVADARCDESVRWNRLRYSVGTDGGTAQEGEGSPTDREWPFNEFTNGSAGSRMAESDCAQASPEGLQRSRELGQPAEDGCGEPMADTERPGRRGRWASEAGSEFREVERPERLCATGELGDPAQRGLGMRRSASGNAGRAAQPGFTNGFWADAEWLWCRDQKYRAVEPGTFPLVTSAPNRVGRLRGYGNALCAEVAKGFIEAYLELMTDN